MASAPRVGPTGCSTDCKNRLQMRHINRRRRSSHSTEVTRTVVIEDLLMLAVRGVVFGGELDLLQRQLAPPKKITTTSSNHPAHKLHVNSAQHRQPQPASNGAKASTHSRRSKLIEISGVQGSHGIHRTVATRRTSSLVVDNAVPSERPVSTTTGSTSTGRSTTVLPIPRW